MKGFPPSFKTVRDLEIGVEYAIENPDFADRMRRELEKIRDSVSFRTLKQETVSRMEAAQEAAEKGESFEEIVLTDDDFELVENPNAILYKMGLAASDIEELLAKLPESATLRLNALGV